MITILPLKSDFIDSIIENFRISFIEDERWRYLWDGLRNTLKLTFFSLLVGLALGIVIAIVRAAWDLNGKNLNKGIKRYIFAFVNRICKIYLAIIRGTPVVVQIMIIFFVIMANSRNKMLAGVVAFGLNSAAYVAEIVRGGIMSVDSGQMEAGRSLGFSFIQTMAIVVLPQAFKNVLPAIGNEFIVLLKETAVAGYVGLTDLTRGADIIRGATFQSFMPLLAVAFIYFILVMFFTWIVGRLERRLRVSER